MRTNVKNNISSEVFIASSFCAVKMREIIW